MFTIKTTFDKYQWCSVYRDFTNMLNICNKKLAIFMSDLIVCLFCSGLELVFNNSEVISWQVVTCHIFVDYVPELICFSTNMCHLLHTNHGGESRHLELRLPLLLRPLV